MAIDRRFGAHFLCLILLYGLCGCACSEYEITVEIDESVEVINQGLAFDVDAVIVDQDAFADLKDKDINGFREFNEQEQFKFRSQRITQGKGARSLGTLDRLDKDGTQYLCLFAGYMPAEGVRQGPLVINLDTDRPDCDVVLVAGETQLTWKKED